MWSGRGPNRVQTFLLNTLKPSTITKYVNALELLNSELKTQGIDWHGLSEDEKDDFLAEWVLTGYEQGGGRAEYSWALSAVQKIFPRLRLRTSWKVLDAWQTLVPVKQAPAAPPELLQAMITLALMLNRPQLAMILLFSYAGLLRIREAINLCGRDVILQQRSVTLCLAMTKGGIEQKVVLTNPAVVQWTFNYLARFPIRHPDRLLFGVSYSSALRWVRKLGSVLGAEALGLTTHTFRRSGATELSRMNVPLSDILLFGRWQSERAARGYIRKGEVAVLRARGMISSTDWKRIDAWAGFSGSAWEHFDSLFAGKDIYPDVKRVSPDILQQVESLLFKL